RAERLHFQIMLLEDARGLAERRRLVLPIVDLTDRNFQRVFSTRWRKDRREQQQRGGNANRLHRFLPFGFCLGFVLAPLVLPFVAAPGFGLRAAASAARTAPSCLPRPSR